MITALIVTFLCILFILQILESVRKRKIKFPPGPIRWPLVGNVIEVALADAKYPHLAMEKLANKYGEVMSLGMGVHPAVVISSFHAMKEILTKDETTSRYPFPFVPDRSFHKGLGLIWGNGVMWREIRRYTLSNLRDFGFGKKGSQESIVREEIREMLNYVKNKAEKNDGIYEMDSHEFGASAVNILWSMVGGQRFSVDDKNFKEFVGLDAKQMEIFSYNNVYNPFPFLRHWFPKWTNYDRHLEIHNEVQSFMKEIVEDMKLKRAGRHEPEPENFIDVFLDQIERVKQDSDNKLIFTEEQLIVVLMDLFLAGSETASTGLSWVFLFLVLNPRVQTQIQNEISQVIPSDQEISASHISKMPYTKAAIYEVMRLSNFVPMPPPRIALHDFKYKDYTIPKGSAIMWNMHPVLNDKKFWGDPEVFRPERFLDETGTQLITSKTERVAIFGFGKRICLGENLGSETVFMYMTSFLRALTLEVVPGFVPSTSEPVSGMTIMPRPYCVKINVRL